VRAETAWGHTFPTYTLDMFNFLIGNCRSFLDLGCGFGRFLQYLSENVDEPDYIGYDSSDSMLNRLIKRFPDYSPRVFLRDITDKITHPQEGVLISAVFVHLPRACQSIILKNLTKVTPKPRAITFDINSPHQAEIDRLKIKQTDHVERFIRTTNQGTSRFRMTWQDHEVFTTEVTKLFPDYTIETKLYDIKLGRNKVVYFLLKKGGPPQV